MAMTHHSMSHHPDDATLMSFAAGSLAEPLALIIAAHCAVCPTCATEVRSMEQVGALLFAALEPESLTRPAPTMALRGLEADVGVPAAGDAELPETASEIPRPLRPLIGHRLDDIAWQRLGLGVWHAPVLPHKSARGDVRLLRVEPGRAMPEHGHGGSELTMILQGSYQDAIGRFGPGDVADLDDAVEHKPVADAQTGCICIIASEKQAVFKGFFARLIQPLTGM
jgi:putative transcriptional regulator